MRSFYQRAMEVVIWVRRRFSVPDDDDAKKRLRIKRRQYIDEAVKENMSTFARRDDDAIIRTLIKDPVASVSASGDEYWTRTWPIQEILLASQLRLQVEHLSISWQRFKNIIGVKPLLPMDESLVRRGLPPTGYMKLFEAHTRRSHLNTLVTPR